MFLTFESVDEILWCYHSNETSSAVLLHGTIYLVCNSNFLSLWMKFYDVTIQMKPLQPYFHISDTIYLVFNSNFWVCG